MFFLAGVSIRFLSLRKRCCTRQLLCVRAQCRRVVVDWHKRALGQQIGRRKAAQWRRHLVGDDELSNHLACPVSSPRAAPPPRPPARLRPRNEQAHTPRSLVIQRGHGHAAGADRSGADTDGPDEIQRTTDTRTNHRGGRGPKPFPIPNQSRLLNTALRARAFEHTRPTPWPHTLASKSQN